MAMAVTHFALGAAFTAFLLALYRPEIRFHGTIVVLGGLWGVLPDIHWVTPIFREELHQFHRQTPFLDVFWFHGILDIAPIAQNRWFAALSTVILLLSVLMLELRVEEIQ